MKGRSAIVLLLVIVFMFLGYLVSKRLQKIIRPRESAGRLVIYFLIIFLMVFLLSFLMVFIIGKLFPAQLMK